MDDMMDMQETYLRKLYLLHNAPGLIHQRVERCRADKCLKDNELEAVYHLVHSHGPQQRRISVHYYEKNSNDHILPLITNTLSLKCSTIQEGIQELLHVIAEMPKEWTIVQLTPQFNPDEILNIDVKAFPTNPIHISVFNCGQKESEPVLMTIDAPKDKVNGKKIELAAEMMSILSGNKDALMFTSGTKMFTNFNEKKEYFGRRQDIENRLMLAVKDVQNMWFKEWRCMFSGKYVNEKLEKKLRLKICDYFKLIYPNVSLSKNSIDLLFCVLKAWGHLKTSEIKAAIQYCLNSNDRDLIRNTTAYIASLYEKFSLFSEKKHPVILVLADELDCFPWEMLDVLEEEPVTRLPSLHFVYTLFKSYENNIVDGHKIVTQYKKGAYVINPDKDLKDMEVRIMQFLNYWLPEWSGISGYKPTDSEFFELLTTSEIFSYNGHGSGAHLVSSKKIYDSCIKAVVLLFGCGSTKVSRVGPQVDMTSAYHMYLTARSPCVVGMLWEVTDIDTDILTTEFMSLWLPSDAPIHWTGVDKTKWKKAEEKVEFVMDKVMQSTNFKKHEPELLRALVAARKCSKYKGTKAACVARGIPIKIVQI